MDWRHGSSIRAPDLQAQSPEFKPSPAKEEEGLDITEIYMQIWKYNEIFWYSSCMLKKKTHSFR
jgi:hypothetical protein